MKEITLDPAEVRELLELIDKHDKHYISDCEEATKIWRIAKREGLCRSYIGDTNGAIFRIGYIAGQRSQRKNRSGNREQRPPLITEPVSEADVKRLFSSYCKSFGYPGGAGVTLKTMTELFGKKIAKGAISRMIPGLEFGVFSLCGHNTMYFTNRGFKNAVLNYCNRQIKKGAQT